MAKAHITLKQIAANQFKARVTSVAALQGASRAAYWTVTEHGHNSNVLAGDNTGKFLKHDLVVRQLVQAGQYQANLASAQKLAFRSIAPTPQHQRQVNLVVFETKTAKTLQAPGLQCAA